jgi:hypothetical protein
MNLNQLKVFYYAAKNSNLSVAAQELFITQPAVTKGIRFLLPSRRLQKESNDCRNTMKSDLLTLLEKSWS